MRGNVDQSRKADRSAWLPDYRHRRGSGDVPDFGAAHGDILNPNLLTAKEAERLHWCYSCLTEEQALEVEEEAIEMASAEIHAPQAAEELLHLLVGLIVRNAREQRDMQ